MGIQVKSFSDESGVCTGLYIYYIHSYMYVYELPYVQNENPHQGRGVFYLCRCIVSRHSLEVQIFYGAFSDKNNSSVNKELIRIGKLAKISKHFSFHSARHTNATLLIYKGANITTVQKLLGHKNLATTQIYGEVMGSTIIRDLKKCQKR